MCSVTKHIYTATFSLFKHRNRHDHEIVNTDGVNNTVNSEENAVSFVSPYTLLPEVLFVSSAWLRTAHRLLRVVMINEDVAVNVITTMIASARSSLHFTSLHFTSLLQHVTCRLSTTVPMSSKRTQLNSIAFVGLLYSLTVGWRDVYSLQFLIGGRAKFRPR